MICPNCHGTGWADSRPCEYEGCAYSTVSCCDIPIDSTSYKSEIWSTRCGSGSPSPHVRRASMPGRGPNFLSEVKRIEPEFRSGNQMSGEVECLRKEWSVPKLEKMAHTSPESFAVNSKKLGEGKMKLWQTAELLREAISLVTGDRAEQHGNMLQNHENIARLWPAYLKNKLTPFQAAMMMALLKIA